jgi:hypothetical protein
VEGCPVESIISLYQYTPSYHMAPRNGRGPTGPRRDRAYIAFDLVWKSVIALADAAPEHPLRPQTVAAWLDQFYGAWVRVCHSSASAVLIVTQGNLEMMARFANVPDLGGEPYAVHAEIEAEAHPFTDVDWVLRFPRISSADRDRLIAFSAILNRLYASAFALGPPPAGEVCLAFVFARCEFRTLYEGGAIPQSEYEWFKRKICRAEADYARECEEVADGPGGTAGRDRSARLRESLRCRPMVRAARVATRRPSWAAPALGATCRHEERSRSVGRVGCASIYHRGSEVSEQAGSTRGAESFILFRTTLAQ